MSKTKGKRGERKVQVPRITIAFSNRRGVLEPVLRKEQEKFPDAHCVLDGRPGEWKVRRDLQDGEDLSSHQAWNMRRALG